MEVFLLQKCKMCDKSLPLGSLKYVVSIKIFADYDAVIQEDVNTFSEEALDMLVDSLDNEDPKKLEDDVYLERLFLLCHQCKKKFSKGLLGNAGNKDVMESPFH